MKTFFLDALRDERSRISDNGEVLYFEGREIPVRNGIPRFSRDTSYVTGNFQKLRQEHASLQLDSKNGTTDRHTTILDRTAWPSEFFKGKTVLECGCGAGPDTEILLKFGAKIIAVDLTADVARQNIPKDKDAAFVQASITDLPFKKKHFDIVWCHRVLQHTPRPEQTLDYILQFVKDEGAVFVHSYAKTFAQMFRWKYALRPFTKHVNPHTLYKIIQSYAKFAFELTNFLHRFPGGRYFNHVVVPFLNYRQVKEFASLSDDRIIEYAIHDTFDALSPTYDTPLSANTMRSIANKHLKRPFEIVEKPSITLLRTKL